MILFVFNQFPRHGQINIFVAGADQFKHGGQRLAVRQVFHVRFHFFRQGFGKREDGVVYLLFFSRRRHDAVKIFSDHGNRAAQQIAKVIGQIRVDAVDQQIFRICAVRAEGKITKQEITHRIHAVFIAQHHRIHHVAFGFAHLSAVKHQPAVAVYLFRQWQAQRL